MMNRPHASNVVSFELILTLSGDRILKINFKNSRNGFSLSIALTFTNWFESVKLMITVNSEKMLL